MVQNIEEMRLAFVGRLKEAASEAQIPGGLGARLAEITGKTPKAASRWLNMETMPGRANMLAIAKALKVRVEWLQFGTLPKRDHELPDPSVIEGEYTRIEGDHENVEPALQAPSRRIRDYPLISWVIAGEWAESHDNYHPGDGEELIPGNAKAGDKGYWLEIKNDSMTPHFPEGTRILIQPEGFDLISGKYYVALLYQPGGKRETTFKQYTRDAGVEYLKPLNKEYRPIEVTDQVRIIGRVIDFDPPKGML